MSTTNKPGEAQHPYRRFGIAVAVYVIGVVFFSGWSYLAHRQIMDPEASSSSTGWSKTLQNVILIESMEGAFMISMAILLVVQYHRAKARSLKQMEALNKQLNRDYQKLKTHESELEEAIKDLERFNALATGREERILELKTEVNALLRELGRTKRYNAAETD